MDEKRPAYAPPPHQGRKSRPILLLLVAAFLVCMLWQVGTAAPVVSLDDLPGGSAWRGLSEEETWVVIDADDNVGTSKNLVPFEAHIMSKCPDARDCLRDMILPAMMRMHDKIDWTLSFVGTPTENDGVDCKHGPSECMGNIIELCAAELYPDPKINLGFTMCITREYSDIPERSLIEACALEHAIDIKELNDCAAKEDGAYGVGLLRDSVTRTAKAGVTKSCTVRLEEEVYCIRDGGEWKDCPHGAGVNDLIIEIEKRYRRRNVHSEIESETEVETEVESEADPDLDAVPETDPFTNP